jgi:energy-coupling factor transporter ATP-binding protein EcfA2
MSNRSILKTLAALAATISITSSFYLGNTPRPYDLVGVRFCPNSANVDVESQAKLDKKYCKQEEFILKETWLANQYSSRKIDNESVRIREIPRSANTTWWYILAPVAMGMAWFMLTESRQIGKQQRHTTIETYKKNIALETLNIRLEQEYKEMVTESNWDGIKIQSGFISTDIIADNVAKQREMMELRHQLEKKQFELAMSAADKEIAENNKVINDSTPTSSDEPKSNKETLEPKHSWIRSIFKNPMTILTGKQGSGKTTLEYWLISLLIKEGFHIVVINPETNPNAWKGNVTVLSQPEDINEYLEYMVNDIDERKAECIENAWDEDDYLKHIADRKGETGRVAVFFCETNTLELHKVDKALLGAALRQSLTNIRKWGYCAFMTAHSDNQTSVSSSMKGLSALMDSIPRVECIPTKNKDGETIASGKAWFKPEGKRDENPQEVEVYYWKYGKNFLGNDVKDTIK